MKAGKTLITAMDIKLEMTKIHEKSIKKQNSLVLWDKKSFPIFIIASSHPVKNNANNATTKV